MKGDIVRVISGSQKGRILKAVSGKNTRPTTDKVKESVFNIIGPYFNKGLGLDLFSGSGSLGIEGISRGLEKVIFVDHHFQAIDTIKKNIQACRFENQSEVLKMDWNRALQSVIQRQLSFKVIWLDPPYQLNVYERILEIIASNHLLDDNGVIVCEHTKDLILPDKVGPLYKWKYSEYGTIAISIYEKELETE